MLHKIGFLKGLYFYTAIYTLFLMGAGITLPQILFANIIYSVASFLGEIPSGMLSDKIGHKRTMVLGYSLDAMSMAIMAFAPSVIGLYLAQSLRGLSGAALSGSEEAMYYESYREEKRDTLLFSKYFGHFQSLNILGFIAASTISGILVQFGGSKLYLPIFVLNIAIITFTALLATRLRDVRIQEISVSQNPFKIVQSSFQSMRSNKIIFALTMFGLLTLNGEYFLRQSYQPYFETLGVLPIFTGLVLGIGSALNFLVVRYSYKLEQWLNLEHILLLHALAQGTLFILFGLFANPIMAVILFILLQSMFNAQNPIVSDYLNARIESARRATMLSTVSFIQQLGQVIIRFFYVGLVGLIGTAHTFKLQGLYMITGALIGFYILTKCGCTYKIKRHTEPEPSLDEIELHPEY